MLRAGKQIKISETEQVITPWLNATEAARYCGMSPTTFRARQRRLPLPHGGDTKTRRYLVPVIDEWLKMLGDK